MLTQVFLIMKEKEKIDNMKIFGWQAKVGGNVITDGYLLAKDQWTECGVEQRIIKQGSQWKIGGRHYVKR